MKLAHNQRFSVAMVLYVCTLFSALTFGFHQSQMIGQHLDSVDLVFCGSGNPIPDVSLGDEQSPRSPSEFELTCPLCTLGHGSALTSLEWSLDFRPADPAMPSAARNRGKPAPRSIWPTLNPRAPPVASRATVLVS